MVVCSAVRYKGNVIIGGARHSDCRLVLFSLVDTVNWMEDIEEGFVNENGEFLSRAAAYHEALKCGQMPAQLRYDKAKRNEFELYSEDLY